MSAGIPENGPKLPGVLGFTAVMKYVVVGMDRRGPFRQLVLEWGYWKLQLLSAYCLVNFST